MAVSISLPAQECRDIEQILRLGLGTQSVADGALPLNRGLIQSGIVVM